MYGHVEIRTLFFASYKELLGTGELQVELPEGATWSGGSMVRESLR